MKISYFKIRCDGRRYFNIYNHYENALKDAQPLAKSGKWKRVEILKVEEEITIMEDLTND